MRILMLTFIITLISGCDKSLITDHDKDLLLSADDLIAIGCKSTKTSDLVYKTSGLKHLSKEITVTYDGHEKCGFYLYMELTEIKLKYLGRNRANVTLGGAIIGLKFSDLEIRKPQETHDGLKGKHLEAYDEKGEYKGFVYVSEEDALSITAMVFGIAKKHQAVLLDLVKIIETRNMDKEKEIPTNNKYFIDAFVIHEIKARPIEENRIS